MKGCNTNIFFKKGEIECFNELNLNHKIKAKAHDILLKSEKKCKSKDNDVFSKKIYKRHQWRSKKCFIECNKAI